MVHRGYQLAKAWEVFSSSGNCLNKMNKKSIHAPLLSSALPHAHTYIYGVNDASQGRGKGRQARLHDKVTANTLPEQAPEQINILPNLSPSTQHICPDLPLRHKQASQHLHLLTYHPHEGRFKRGNTPPFGKRYLRPIVVAEQSYIAPQCDLYCSQQGAVLLHLSTTIGTHLGLISLHAAKYIAGALPLKRQPTNDAEEERSFLSRKEGLGRKKIPKTKDCEW